MTIFIVTLLDLFDIVLGQDFFQRRYTMIDPYLQELFMKKGGSCMVALIKVPNSEGQAQLSNLQLVKGINDKKSLSYSILARKRNHRRKPSDSKDS